MTPAQAPEGAVSLVARVAALAAASVVCAVDDDPTVGPYRAAGTAVRDVARLLARTLAAGASDPCTLRRDLLALRTDAERAADLSDLDGAPDLSGGGRYGPDDVARQWRHTASLAALGASWWKPCEGCRSCREHAARCPSVEAVRPDSTPRTVRI